MAKPQKTQQEPQEDLNPVMFFRVAALKLKDSYHPAFRTEVITIQGDKVIAREWVGKIDTKQMAYATAQDLLDDSQE